MARTMRRPLQTLRDTARATLRLPPPSGKDVVQIIVRLS